MQLPTHVIAGILLQQFISSSFNVHPVINVALIIVVCFFSHFIIDTFSLLTYHPPQREYTNFWLIWHLFVYSAGIFLFLAFFNPYWLGMISANVVDLWDWYFLRPLGPRIDQPDLQERFGLHFIVSAIRKPLISLGLPNLSYKKVGIIPELLLIIPFLIVGGLRILNI